MNAFLDRPIEGDWPYLWLDATYVKVREAGRIVSVAVTVAVGVNTDARRDRVPSRPAAMGALARHGYRSLVRVRRRPPCGMTGPRPTLRAYG